jgi:hypothetical protein
MVYSGGHDFAEARVGCAAEFRKNRLSDVFLVADDHACLQSWARYAGGSVALDSAGDARLDVLQP